MAKPAFDPEPRWYCVQTKPKQEHIATALLQKQLELEAFCPRISYLKKTRRGKVRFTEALFPGYTFAKFEIGEFLRAVNGTQGVSRIVRFGEDIYIPMPDDAISDWQDAVDDDRIITIEEELSPGDEVEVMDGPMKGMQTVISTVLPAQQRVNILMEFLGEYREVTVNRDDVSKKENIRLASPTVSR